MIPLLVAMLLVTALAVWGYSLVGLIRGTATMSPSVLRKARVDDVLLAVAALGLAVPTAIYYSWWLAEGYLLAVVLAVACAAMRTYYLRSQVAGKRRAGA